MNTIQKEDLKIEAQREYGDFSYFYENCAARVWFALLFLVPLFMTFLEVAVCIKAGKSIDREYEPFYLLYMAITFLVFPFIAYGAKKKLFFLIYPKYRNALNTEKG